MKRSARVAAVALAILAVSLVGLVWSLRPRASASSAAPTEAPSLERRPSSSGELQLASAPEETNPERTALSNEPAPAPVATPLVFDLHGKVVDASGNPFEHFGVHAIRRDAYGGIAERREIPFAHHPLGEFDFVALPPGGWEVAPFAPHHGLLQPRRFWEPDTNRNVYVMLHWGHVSGVVLDSQGQRMRGAFVGTKTPGFSFIASTDEDGRFDAWLPPDRWALVATGQRQWPSAPVAVALELDRAAVEVQLQLQPACMIRGRIVDGRGLALAPLRFGCASGRIRLQPDGCTVSEDGTIDVCVTDPSEHWLAIWQGDERVVDWSFRPSSGKTFEFEIASTCPRPVRVHGVAPMGEFLRVTATRKGEAPVFSARKEAPVLNGRFALELCAAGTYEFELEPGKGAKWKSKVVEVPDTHDFELVWSD